MSTVLVVRPEPGNTATLHAARRLGLAAKGFPLFVAEPRQWDCPGPEAFDGLVIASANAVRHAGPQLERLRALPVHAVGEATADAARQAGLRVATVGAAGLDELLPRLRRPARLLRLAGEEHVAIAPPADLAIETRVVYAMAPRPLPSALADELRRPCLVLLHSAAAARRFAGECERLNVARGEVALACLSSRIAAAAGRGWRTVACAEVPSDAALLALAQAMCQTGASGVTNGGADGR